MTEFHRDSAAQPSKASEGVREAPVERAAVASRPPPSWAAVGIFLLLLVAGFAYARVFLLPVVLAFLVTLVFTPVRRFLERLGVPPVVSALLIVGSLVALLVTAVYALSGPVQSWMEEAPRIGRELEERLHGVIGSAREMMEAGAQVDELAGADEGVPEVVVRENTVLGTVASLAPGILAQGVVTLVLLLLLLASGDLFYAKIVHVMPTFHDKRRAMRIAYDIEAQLSHYLFAITLVNAALGFCIGLAMWLIGMPNPLLFGVAGFALNYVPYVGAAVGVSVATVVGLVTFDDVWYGLLPGAAYLSLNVVESNVATPYFVGRRLEMNTVVVFIAIAFWAWLWSVMGMLVAVPLLVTIRAFSEYIPQLYPLAEFLAARHATPPDT